MASIERSRIFVIHKCFRWLKNAMKENYEQGHGLLLYSTGSRYKISDRPPGTIQLSTYRMLVHIAVNSKLIITSYAYFKKHKDRYNEVSSIYRPPSSAKIVWLSSPYDNHNEGSACNSQDKSFAKRLLYNMKTGDF